MLDQNAQRERLIKAGPLLFGPRGWQRNLAQAISCSENFMSMALGGSKNVPETWMLRLVAILRFGAGDLRRRADKAEKFADKIEREAA